MEPEDSVFKNAIGFTEDNDDSNKMLANAAAHAVGLVTNVLSSQGPAIRDATVLDIDNSMLSGVTRFVDTGVQAMKQDPIMI